MRTLLVIALLSSIYANAIFAQYPSQEQQVQQHNEIVDKNVHQIPQRIVGGQQHAAHHHHHHEQQVVSNNQQVHENVTHGQHNAHHQGHRYGPPHVEKPIVPGQQHVSQHQHGQQVVSNALEVHEHVSNVNRNVNHTQQHGQQHGQQHVVQHIPNVHQKNNDSKPDVPKINITGVVQHVKVPHKNFTVPARVQHIVNQVHKHIPQIVNHHIAQKKQGKVENVVDDKEVKPEIPARVLGDVGKDDKGVLQVIKHHSQQQQHQQHGVNVEKKPEVNVNVDNAHVVGNPHHQQHVVPVVNLPINTSHISHEQLRQFIPQMIAFLTQQTQQLQQMISTFQPTTPQPIKDVQPSKVPAVEPVAKNNLENVLQMEKEKRQFRFF